MATPDEKIENGCSLPPTQGAVAEIATVPQPSKKNSPAKVVENIDQCLNTPPQPEHDPPATQPTEGHQSDPAPLSPTDRGVRSGDSTPSRSHNPYGQQAYADIPYQIESDVESFVDDIGGASHSSLPGVFPPAQQEQGRRNSSGNAAGSRTGVLHSYAKRQQPAKQQREQQQSKQQPHQPQQPPPQHQPPNPSHIKPLPQFSLPGHGPPPLPPMPPPPHGNYHSQPSSGGPTPNDSRSGTPLGQHQFQFSNDICRHYVQGRCSWGNTCRFVHPPGAGQMAMPGAPPLPPQPPQHFGGPAPYPQQFPPNQQYLPNQFQPQQYPPPSPPSQYHGPPYQGQGPPPMPPQGHYNPNQPPPPAPPHPYPHPSSGLTSPTSSGRGTPVGQQQQHQQGGMYPGYPPPQQQGGPGLTSPSHGPRGPPSHGNQSGNNSFGQLPPMAPPSLHRTHSGSGSLATPTGSFSGMMRDAHGQWVPRSRSNSLTSPQNYGGNNSSTAHPGTSVATSYMTTQSLGVSAIDTSPQDDAAFGSTSSTPQRKAFQPPPLVSDIANRPLSPDQTQRTPNASGQTTPSGKQPYSHNPYGLQLTPTAAERAQQLHREH